MIREELAINFDAVVLAAGDFPTNTIALELLSKYRDRVICCDSAADALLTAGFDPMLVVGDCDSLSSSARELLADRLVIDPTQESNDLTKTIRHCVSLGMTRLLILGATGKREDHTLGNISLLTDYMRYAQVVMCTDYGTFVPATGKTTFHSYIGQQVSIFCLDASPLSLRGLQWSFENRTLTAWWQATLNCSLGDRFEVETAGRVVVFRKF
jgi:thiamine pyrophosphokinase